jgi:hypothetical protein
MSCFQCDLDIPHVCYAGTHNARWGLGDEAMAVLEGAQLHGYMLTPAQRHARERSSVKVPTVTRVRSKPLRAKKRRVP